MNFLKEYEEKIVKKGPRKAQKTRKRNEWLNFFLKHFCVFRVFRRP